MRPITAPDARLTAVYWPTEPCLGCSSRTGPDPSTSSIEHYSTFDPAAITLNPDMFVFLLSLLILDALLLSVVVLLQAGQGGGLASLGGGTTDTVLGGRQAVTILTKLSWWCGGIFLLLSLILSFVPRGGASSALQQRLRAASPAAPAQAPLPLGQSGEPAPSAGKTSTPPASEPATGSKSAPAPLPLGEPTKPATGAPAPQKPKK
jgi:preprotein translocase subunit SecG